VLPGLIAGVVDVPVYGSRIIHGALEAAVIEPLDAVDREVRQHTVV